MCYYSSATTVIDGFSFGQQQVHLGALVLALIWGYAKACIDIFIYIKFRFKNLPVHGFEEVYFSAGFVMSFQLRKTHTDLRAVM